MENNSIIYTFTTEISELKLNKLTNSYYFNFKYNISDNDYHTVDLTGYNQYESEGIRKDFIDMISNMSKIAADLSEKIESGDILKTSNNIKLEGQKPVNNEPFTLGIYTNDFSDLNRKVIDMFPDTKFLSQEEQLIRKTKTEAYKEAFDTYTDIYNKKELELKQQINKLSEKNKKLKSKNRKLKKQLTIINTGE